MSGRPKSKKRASGLEFVVNEKQADFDVRFYDAILARNENNIDVLRQLVDLVAVQGDYQRVLELDQRLVQLRPTDCLAKYNLACSLSVLGQTAAALSALEEAISLGYNDFAHLEADSDLEAVRQHSGYRLMLKKLTEGRRRA